jgi:hypothetical protein
MKKQACLFESQKCTRIHDNAIIVAKYHYSGKFIATASADKKAKITSTKSGEVVQTLTEHTLGLNDCVWIGASHLATGSDDKLIKLWDVEKGVKISSISCHKSFVFALASHPYSDLLLSGSCDGSIRITDIRTGNCVRAIEAHADVVSCLDINPSNHGREFVSCEIQLIILCTYFRILDGDALTIVCFHTHSFFFNRHLAATMDQYVRGCMHTRVPVHPHYIIKTNHQCK